MASIPRVRLLGVEVDVMALEDIHRTITRAVEGKERRILANHNLHSVYLCHKDPLMRLFYASSDFIHVDGMALIAVGRLLALPLRRIHRLTYVDIMSTVFEQTVSHGWRAYYLGSKASVAERGALILQERFPGLQLRTNSGYFDARPGSAENQQILHDICSFDPQLLFVGMGMPRQEQWILANLSHLPANVVFNVGAYMDYIVGELPTPPRWAGRIGLEWLFRLCAEPGRLWKRYLLEPWFLLGLLLQESLLLFKE